MSAGKSGAVDDQARIASGTGSGSGQGSSAPPGPPSPYLGGFFATYDTTMLRDVTSPNTQ